MNNMTNRIKGLYLITDYHLCEKVGLVPAVAAAIQGGANMVQYRNKYATRDRKLWEVQDLITLCRPLGIPLIVNDDIEIALESGADGVHLGGEDGSIKAEREKLGEKAIIGASCYDSIESAIQAAADGASYLAFGRFFPSQTKPDAVTAPIEIIEQIKIELGSRANLPIIAIGGINQQNAASLIKAGADMVAVVNAVLGAENIEKASREISTLF